MFSKLKGKSNGIIIIILILLVGSMLGRGATYTYEDLPEDIFDNLVLKEQLPVIFVEENEVAVNGKQSLELNMKDYHVYNFNDYTDECKKIGYVLSGNYKKDISYSAYNNAGYKMTLTYDETTSTMNVIVEKSVNNSDVLKDQLPSYVVDMEVECWENLIFSKYDVQIFIDGKYKGSVKQGETTKLSVDLSKGKHVVRFVSEEDENLVSENEIVVSEDTIFKYEINTHSDYIEYDRVDYLHVGYTNSDLGKLKVDEVYNQYKELGYTDIRRIPLYDLDYDNYDKKNNIAKEIEISDNNEFKKTDRKFSYQIVEIYYHSAKKLTLTGNSKSLIKLKTDDVVEYMKDLGFINVTTRVYDGISYGNEIYEITIDGNNKFEPGDQYAFDVPVVIYYYK